MRGIRVPRQNLSENFVKLAQRFSAGLMVLYSVSPGRDERSVLPSLRGLASNCVPNPALERLGYCRLNPLRKAGGIVDRHRGAWGRWASF